MISERYAKNSKRDLLVVVDKKLRITAVLNSLFIQKMDWILKHLQKC